MEVVGVKADHGLVNYSLNTKEVVHYWLGRDSLGRAKLPSLEFPVNAFFGKWENHRNLS